MKNISGIKFNRDTSGQPKSVTIDLEKHGKALHYFLDKSGALSDQDDDFEKKWKEGITGDELVSKVKNHIKTLPWKK